MTNAASATLIPAIQGGTGRAIPLIERDGSLMSGAVSLLRSREFRPTPAKSARFFTTGAARNTTYSLRTGNLPDVTSQIPSGARSSAVNSYRVLQNSQVTVVTGSERISSISSAKATQDADDALARAAAARLQRMRVDRRARRPRGTGGTAGRCGDRSGSTSSPAVAELISTMARRQPSSTSSAMTV